MIVVMIIINACDPHYYKDEADTSSVCRVNICTYKNDNYRTNVLGHRTAVGGDGGGGDHGGRADGDEDQEQLEEDHLGPG